VGVAFEEARTVIQAQYGDRDAMERLLRGVQPRLHAYLLRLVGADHAGDVLQDVLIAIARKLAWLADPQLFRPWAFRIASRAAFRHLRREQRWRQTDDMDFDALPAPEAPPSDDRLRELLDSPGLSPGSRAVLVLHFQEEMPLADVAAVLEIPVGTAKSRLAYGLKALRRHLGDRRSF
jgi:RNA polymerase sigma-70 factor (ECF subfamily)